MISHASAPSSGTDARETSARRSAARRSNAKISAASTTESCAVFATVSPALSSIRNRIVAGSSPASLASLTEAGAAWGGVSRRSEEHTSELQSRLHLVCRLLLEKKKNKK